MKESRWVWVFVASALSFTVIVTFADWWRLIFATAPGVAALAAFAYLYQRGKGLPISSNDDGSPNR